MENYSSKSSWNASKSLEIASSYLVHKGFIVAQPRTEDTPADLVVQGYSSSHPWKVVQVKTAYMDGGSWVANVCRTTQEGRAPYHPGEVDYYVVVVPEKGLLLLPFDVVAGRSRIRPMAAEFDGFFVEYPGGVK